MKNINSRIIKRFNEIYDNTNINSADGIYKKMNREGYSITVKTVRDSLKKTKKEMNYFIPDRDEETDDDEYYDDNDDDEYSDDEEEKTQHNSRDLPIPAGLSTYIKPPEVPIAYNPTRDPQYMFGVALMPKYCLDDKGRLIKIKEYINKNGCKWIN